MYDELITQCPLFKDLSDDRLGLALVFFGAKEKEYDAGSILNRPGEPLNSFALVLSGNVQVCMEDMDGNRILMAAVPPGGTFGESLCFLKRPADIIISCLTDTKLLVMNTDSLYSNTKNDPDTAEFSRRFCAMIASKTLGMNNRIQILTKSGIREKIRILLSEYSVHPGDEITLPYNRESLAMYLGVNRSALSRELCKMRDEGIIEFKGNRFKIL